MLIIVQGASYVTGSTIDWTDLITTYFELPTFIIIGIVCNHNIKVVNLKDADFSRDNVNH